MNVKLASTLLAVCLLLVSGCGSTKDLPTDDTSMMDTSSNQDTSYDDQATVDTANLDPFAGAIDVTDRYNAGSTRSYAELLATTVLFFDFDRAEIRPENQEVIAAHARYLNENPSLKLRLEGHADERGSREYNIGLGQRRAESVRRSFSLQGAQSGQISTISFGEEKPLDTGHSESSWAANRRVELMYN